jgi:hypothetical protein
MILSQIQKRPRARSNTTDVENTEQNGAGGYFLT